MAKGSKAKAVTPSIGTIDPMPDELVSAVKEDRCALFVGAGLSKASGYPLWTELLETLIKAAETLRSISVSGAKELRTLAASKEASKLLMVAQELSDRVGREVFLEEIVKVFSDDTKMPSAAHNILPTIPFDLILTTNYDRLLERAYASPGHVPRTYTHNNAPDFADALWRRKFFILKAHGDVDHRTEIVVTERDYRDIIFRSQGYRAAMSAIFTMRSVLFIGVSLDDPELRLLLGYLYDVFHGSGSYHFALVPKSQFSETTVSRWLKDYKVRCILYDPTNGHPEVPEFLAALANAVK
jgi:hypothetical protein